MRPEPRRSWHLAEIIQTSTMDCGPAALAALLAGHGIAADYGRLREACQTDVDGTSIDVIETVLNQLGLAAEQVMLPPDRLFGPMTPSLPAIAVTRLADGAPHFVVVWRRLGPFVQVMDPSEGRRWMRRTQLLPRLLRHKMSVPAQDWLDWARGPEGLPPLVKRLAALGQSEAAAEAALAGALANKMWFPMAAAEAALRLVEGLRADGALPRGGAAIRLWQALYDETLRCEDDIYARVPKDFWSVFPDPESLAHGERRLLIEGAVLVRVTGLHAHGVQDGLPADLAAALRPAAPGPWSHLWQILRQDGLGVPLLLIAALALVLPVSLVEAVVFRILTSVSADLASADARAGFVTGAMGLMLALFLIRLPIGAEAMRLGRRLDLRLRMALLAKLPRLSDRFHASRPVSDMADRAQSLHLLRALPGMALHGVQAAMTLGLTAAGLIFLDPASLLWVLALTLAAVLMPFVAASGLAEGELALRTKSAALAGVWHDALRGQAAIRAHHAQAAMRVQHEALLTQVLSVSRRLSDRAALLALLRQAVGLALIVGLILQHADRQGLDLLFLWWVFKLPEAGADLAGLIRQLPVQRAILARLIEPLSAPERSAEATHTAPGRRMGPAGLDIRHGLVVAGGHQVLCDVNLTIAPGEHVAIVGASGSGKSSLVGLFMGWHRLAEGEVLLDGVTMTEGDLQVLRGQTAWVDPAVQLWNDSLAANLAFAAPEAGSADLASVVQAAGLRHVVAERPAGLGASIGEGGSLLSGGEGQRLRLGRALLQQDVRLAILDEPFRGLDHATRKQLLDRARAHWQGATLLWVTHDLAEIASFDRVLVVEQGRIAQDGVPADLAAGPGAFADLLQADAEVQKAAWGRDAWARLWLEAGHVRCRD